VGLFLAFDQSMCLGIAELYNIYFIKFSAIEFIIDFAFARAMCDDLAYM